MKSKSTAAVLSMNAETLAAKVEKTGLVAADQFKALFSANGYVTKRSKRVYGAIKRVSNGRKVRSENCLTSFEKARYEKCFDQMEKDKRYLMSKGLTLNLKGVA